MNHIWATIVREKNSASSLAGHLNAPSITKTISSERNQIFQEKSARLYSNVLTMKFLLTLTFILVLHVALSPRVMVYAAFESDFAVDDVVTTGEDVPIAINILANDAPVNDLDLDSFEIVLAPSYGSYSVQQSDDIEIVYQPYANFWGDDLFEYKICDASGTTCDTALVTILVEAVNDQLIAIDDTAAAIAGESVEIDILANDLDYDFDMDPASLSIVTPTVRGTIEVVGQHIVYVATESGGIDQFAYQICELPSQPAISASCSVAIVQIITGDVQEITTSAKPSSATNIGVSDRPEDRSSQIEIQIVDNPQNGSVSINIDGTFLYQPNSGFLGTDTIMIEACRAPNDCSVLQYTITVEPLHVLLPFVNL